MKLNYNIIAKFAVLILLVQTIFSFNIAQAETTPEVTVKVEQVGTSGGIPAIKAALQNAGETGTYSLVITNPKTGSTYSQVLNRNGKATTFAITNFTENGTYSYSLQVNGLELLTGGVNLVSATRTPSFAVQLNGTDLTVDISGGNDYVGQTIFFRSGGYSNSLTLEKESMQVAFENVKDLEGKMTFSSEKGDLTTVDVVKSGGGSTKPNNPGTSAGNSNNTNNNNNTVNKPATQVPATGVNTNTNAGTTNSLSPQKNVKIALNQQVFKLEQTIVATVEVVNTDYAAKSVSVRLGADAESSVALVYLDKNGKGSSTFKFKVPQPSSKTISATVYSISGSLLQSASTTYGVEGEVAGTELKEDGDFSQDNPYAEYVSLDLTVLESQTARLAWYGARNISKFETRLKVINNTNNEERSYSVFMPDGDSSINLKLAYDGPGIYTWELYAGGKKIAQAPYSTPLGIDTAQAVSQDGLPVLKTLPNKDVYLANLDGIDPDAVNGAIIGEPLEGVVADDVSENYWNVEQPVQPEEGGKKGLLLIIAGVLLLIIGVVLFLLIKRKRETEDPETTKKFEEYKEDHDDENSSDDPSRFEEVG